MSFLERLRTWMNPPRSGGDAFREVRAVVNPCPICKQGAAAHAFHELGVVEAGSNLARQMAELAAAGDWKQVSECRVADMGRDLLVWRVYRCPTGQIAVATAFSPVGLSANDRVENFEEIADRDETS
jgi:hypothetical protein